MHHALAEKVLHKKESCDALRSVIVTKSYSREKYHLVLSMQGTVRLF